MVNVATGSAPAASGSSGGQTYRAALAMVTTLFFFWGFVTVLNDILVPHLKSIFDLNYTKVMLIQFAFFFGIFYFFDSVSQGDRHHWLQEDDGGGTCDHGSRRISIHSGGERAVVCIVSRRVDGAGGGNYGLASSGECLRVRAGTTGDSIEQIEFDTSV